MRTNQTLLGIGMIVLAMFLFASKDGMAKALVTDLSPLFLIWGQYVFTLAIMGGITLVRFGPKALLPTPFGKQLFRGLSAAAGVGLFYWSLSYIGLAEATALALFAPIVVAALAPVLLGEKNDFGRWMAVLVGFAGAIIMVRPAFLMEMGLKGEAEGYIIGFGAGQAFGLYYMGNRMVGGIHSQIATSAHTVIIGLLLSIPWIPDIWQNPEPTQWPFLILFFSTAMMGQFMLVNSFKHAPANVLAPFQFTVIVFAAIIGLIFFGALPGWQTWLGVALVIGAGLYLARQQSKPKMVAK